MSDRRLAVVGATGAVGRTLLSVLEERDFPMAELRLMASARSAGSKVTTPPPAAAAASIAAWIARVDFVTPSPAAPNALAENTRWLVGSLRAPTWATHAGRPSGPTGEVACAGAGEAKAKPAVRVAIRARVLLVVWFISAA